MRPKTASRKADLPLQPDVWPPSPEFSGHFYGAGQNVLLELRRLVKSGRRVVQQGPLRKIPAHANPNKKASTGQPHINPNSAEIFGSASNMLPMSCAKVAIVGLFAFAPPPVGVAPRSADLRLRAGASGRGDPSTSASSSSGVEKPALSSVDCAAYRRMRGSNASIAGKENGLSSSKP